MPFKRFLKHIISTIIPDKVYAHHIIRILYYGVFRFFRDSAALKSQYADTPPCGQFAHKLAVCAIMKNEGPYLREWIEYHRAVGVDKFYLYDNNSTDDTKKILAPYIKSGLVEYTYFPGEKRQLPAYNDCIARFKMDAQWIAFVDLDEFMVPKKFDTMPELLDYMSDDNINQFVLDWQIFGSNGHEKKPRGLVIESYTMCARRPWLYKSIVNPRMVFSMSCHEHNVAFWTYHVPRKIAQVNHYHCKSWAEYQKRATRGDAWDGKVAGHTKYQRETFERHNHNEVYDNAILRFAPAVRRALKK